MLRNPVWLWSSESFGRKRAAYTGGWDPVSPRNTAISHDRRAAETALRQQRGVKQRALNASRWLGDLPDRGREQAGVESPGPLERRGSDGDVDQRIEPTDRADVACLGSLDAQVLGLAVDALTTGTLGVDGLVERALPIQQGAHQAAFLPIGVFDAAFALGELGMLAGLSGAGGKEQGAAKALGAKAIGVLKLVGG